MIIFTPNTLIKSAEVNANIADLDVRTTVLEYKVAFRAYRNTTQAVSDSTFTIVQLNAEEYDIGNNFDTSTYKFMPPYNGIYHFDGAVAVGNNSTRVIAQIAKTGTEIARGSNGVYATNGANRSSVSTDVYLTTSDYIELKGWRFGAGNLQNEGVHGLFLSGHLVRVITI